MDFPPLFPDLNPSERLWWRLKTEEDNYSVVTREALSNAVK